MVDNSNKERLQDLAHKWLNGTLLESEQLEFDQWFTKEEDEIIEIPSTIAKSDAEHQKVLLSKIHSQINRKEVKSLNFTMWVKIAAAAAIILVLSVGIYKIYFPATPLELWATNLPDIKPGGNNAVLTLSNGNKIILNNAANGNLAKETGSVINKTNDGRVTYIATNLSVGNTVGVNTISTPRGGQYEVVLPDNSKVWLNASSSITFPTAFQNSTREVSITGEVYFEVAKDKTKPFRVTGNGQVTEVLGTHFNINAYTDEPQMITTLLEGAVKINNGGHTALLRPGQQAIIGVKEKGSIEITDNPDADEAVAWINGKFKFKNADIPTVMRQLERWYNVNVEFAGKIPDEKFNGTLSRNIKISDALILIGYTRINYTIEGRKIIIK
jgi:transmembrane sensor